MRLNQVIINTEIISQIKARNQSGLSTVYDMYASPLMGIIFRIVKNNELAEEILQHTMLKVWNKIDLYDQSKSNFFTWIAAIARNTALDKRRLKTFENREKTDSLDATVLIPETHANPNQKIDVEKITSVLDEKYKIVIDKLYLEGYSQGDLAKELDIPLGTIKTRVRMAMNILR